jgi:asparagine synthetase B (glutamine-hydrolysing)
LFVLGWSPSSAVSTRPAEAALRSLVSRLPFLDAADLETWCAPSGAAALAFVTHRPDQTGGVHYIHREEGRMAFFSGRPFCWTGDAKTDGRAPLDPRFYLAPVEDWMYTLDGRVVAAYYDDTTRTLDLWTDPLGSYPVFATEHDGVRWISNNAEALRTLRGSDAQDPIVLASFLGGGYALDGNPRWADVKRLPRGVVHHHRPEAPNARTELLSTTRIAALFGAGWNPQDAAAVLVATLQGLADWPGRPNVVPVTGGRDSRLVLAAALRAGFDFSATTGGASDSADVRIGRLLCRTVGIKHEPLGGDLRGTVHAAPELAVRIVTLSSSGTTEAGVDPYLPLSPPEGPLVLWHSGQGGEGARGYYGLVRDRDRDGLVRQLMRIFLNLRPQLPTLLSREGLELVKSRLRDWVDEQLSAGIGPVDVLDAFFLLQDNLSWAGSSYGCSEWVMDRTMPLGSPRLLPYELGAPAAERAREVFHLHVLEALAPELVHLPFAGPQSGWPALRSRRRRRAELAFRLAGKAIAELRRHGPQPLAPPDPLANVLTLVREHALSQREHAAWEVLDTRRVERLLASDPRSLRVGRRQQVWWLATVFLSPEPGGEC